MDIWTYIAMDSPSAESRMDNLFSEAAARLAEFPYSGRTGKIPVRASCFRTRIIDSYSRSKPRPYGSSAWFIRPGAGHLY